MAGPRKAKIITVASETTRLRKIFKDIPAEKHQVVEGLIVQAARLRVLLDQAWDDIQERGDTEMFSQSPNTEPYERERPVARLFNARDKNYQTTIRMLIDMLPDDEAGADGDAEDLMKFSLGGRLK